MPRWTALAITSNEVAWLGLSAALREMHDVHLVGEPACPERARALAATLRPDVILSATRVGGVAMSRVLLDLQRGTCPVAKIVFFSAGVDPADIAATDGLQYDGWLLWPELSAEGLPHVLRAIVFGGARVGSPSIVDALFVHGRRPGSDGFVPATIPLRISPREREVLDLLARDGDEELTFAEIGHHLGTKTSSIATYVERLGTKLDVRRGGRRTVLAAARHHGVLTPPVSSHR